MKSIKPILLVEDDEVDAMVVKRALAENKVLNPLDVCTDGEAALARLRDPAKSKPCIILLDLNMPRMSGIEFLHEAKADARLRHIPVVVLTSSSEPRDRLATYDLGIAGYMVKPVDYRHYVSMVSIIDRYWSESELPPN